MRKRSIRTLVLGLATATALSLSLSACSPEYWPAAETEESESPGTTPQPSVLEDTLPKPSVTVQQFERVLESTREVFSQADEARDADLLSSRAAGAVLEARTVNYEAREEDGDIDAFAGIPDGEIQLVLPEQNEQWPRHVLAIVGWEDDTQVPEALVFRQSDARASFKLVYQVYLQAGVQLPEVAASQVGAPVISTESELTVMQPQNVPGAYADIFTEGEDAEHYAAFESEPDELRASLGYTHKQDQYVDNDSYELVDFEFVNGEGSSPVISMSTNDGGAIVAGSFSETIEFNPTEDGVTVSPPEGSSLSALLGGEEGFTSGFSRTDEYQVLFYVPAGSRGDDDAPLITVLGYNAALVGAEELD